MRVLHTADWHLGRGFHGASLMDAHAAVLDHLVEVTATERPDAVVVAGDIFDRAYPPLDAVELYEDAVARIAETGVPLVLTSGNHDSAIRLGMHAGAARAGGVHIRTRARDAATPVLVETASGTLAIYPVPYLDPPSVAAQLGLAEASHQAVLGAALAGIRADLTARGNVRSVVMAHAVVAGGTPASSADGDRVERSIDVGGVSAVPPSLLAGFDYVALGHLHRPQRIGSDRVRYSGAPLPFGFDEVGDRKSLALVTLRSEEPPTVQLLPTPLLRPLARLRGTVEELLAGEEHAAAEHAWVEATVTDRLLPRGAMERLRQRFPHVVKLEHRPPASSGERSTAASYSARLRDRSELDIAAQFLADVRGGVAGDEDELRLLTQALEAGERSEALQ